MLAETTSVQEHGSQLSIAFLKRLDVKISSLICGRPQISTEFQQSGAAQAALYHLRSGGRRIRGRLAWSACLPLGLSENDALCIAATCELLHNASLIHDDLQDGDELRRGLPTVWAKFGADIAICTGDLMLSAAYAALCGISDLRKVPVLLARVHELTALAIAGQCADLRAPKQPVVDIDTYEKIVIDKSGALLSLPLELALITSGEDVWADQARKAAEAFSLAYQVADDLSDLSCDARLASLNIVSVLESAGVHTDALAGASRLGVQYLDRAVAEAWSLPCDAGALLLQLCGELRESFNSKE